MRSGIVALCLAVFLLSSCASGRIETRRERKVSRKAASSDRLATRKSSYRIRGTDEVGALSSRQHAALRNKTRTWFWPLKSVALTSKFGYRDGDFHDGVDLRAPIGTPVYSVAPGTVIYSGAKIRGYGKMVVIRHGSKMSTVYAHNSRIFVRQGQKVSKGQRIALSGNTGRSSGPHVHFEIREGVTAINPYLLLPSPASHNETQRRIAQSDRVSSGSSASRRMRRSAGRPAARLVADDGFKPRQVRKFN